MLKDSLFLHRFLALAKAAIVSIILVTLGVPLVVVAWSQMYVGLISRIAGEVIEVKRFSRVPAAVHTALDQSLSLSLCERVFDNVLLDHAGLPYVLRTLKTFLTLLGH